MFGLSGQKEANVVIAREREKNQKRKWRTQTLYVLSNVNLRAEELPVVGPYSSEVDGVRCTGKACIEDRTESVDTTKRREKI